MVICSCMIDVGSMLLLAVEQTDGPVLERLDPPLRAAVVMALLALTLTGLFLVTFAMIGGRWVRRLARQRPNTEFQGAIQPNRAGRATCR